jgi:hypothetical protein
MSAPGSAQRPGAQRPVIAAGLLLISLTLCAWMCVDGVRLMRLGPPWAAPVAVDLSVLTGPTATLTPPLGSATPGLAATLDPLLPTPTFALAPVDVLPPGGPCFADAVSIEAADPPNGASLSIGRDTLAVTVTYCLNSRPAGRLQLAVVSAAAQAQTLPFAGPLSIRAGDGRYTQSLDWGAAPWSPELAGQYRLAAAILDAEGGPFLVSAFGGLYKFEP